MEQPLQADQVVGELALAFGALLRLCCGFGSVSTVKLGMFRGNCPYSIRVGTGKAPELKSELPWPARYYAPTHPG